MKRKIGFPLLATAALALAGMIGPMTYAHAQDASDGGIRLAELQKKGVAKSAPRNVGTPHVGQSHVGPSHGGGSVGRTRTIETRKTTVTRKTVVTKHSGTTTVVRGGGHGGFRAVGRGTGHVVFHGRNFSVWRGGPYRVRYGRGWRTFVALSTLTAIAVAGATYYPYAYVSAPEPICEGTTDDGCVLQWNEVPTVEGPPALQCVAYCPWEQ